MRLGADASGQNPRHGDFNFTANLNFDVFLAVVDHLLCDALILFGLNPAVVHPHLQLLLRRIVLEELIGQILAEFLFLSVRHRPRCLKRPAALKNPTPRLWMPSHDTLRVRFPVSPVVQIGIRPELERTPHVELGAVASRGAKLLCVFLDFVWV